MQTGRAVLRYIKRRKRFNDKRQQNCREFLKVIRKAERESFYTKVVQQSTDSGKWQGYIKQDMSWHNLLKSSPQLVSFCFEATYNTLASPQNQACWGFEDDIECALCGKEASAAHILAGCQKALQIERYTFRHNAVLTVIVHEMQVMINQVKKEVRKVWYR